MINHRAIGVFLYMETFISPSSGSQDLTAFHQPSHQNWKFGTFAAAFVDTGCPQLHSWPQVSGICAWKLYLKLFIGPTQPKQNPEFVYIQKIIQKKCIVNWLLSPDIWRKTASCLQFVSRSAIPRFHLPSALSTTGLRVFSLVLQVLWNLGSLSLNGDIWSLLHIWMDVEVSWAVEPQSWPRPRKSHQFFFQILWQPCFGQQMQ